MEGEDWGVEGIGWVAELSRHCVCDCEGEGWGIVAEEAFVGFGDTDEWVRGTAGSG